jgi:hypothetical protein
MSYRVITSDYTMCGGSYQVLYGTERCVGEGYNYRDAHLSTLQHDTRYKLAWYQKLHEGIWYECDSNGNPLTNRPADPQSIPYDEDIIVDMQEDPEGWNCAIDSNGNYIIPTVSGPTNV